MKSYRITPVIGAFFLLTASSANSADPGWVEVGARVGFSDKVKGEDFNQYEIVGIYRLPWDHEYDSGWRLDTRLNTSLGVLNGGGTTAPVMTIGPGIAFLNPSKRFVIDAGISPTLLGTHKFGEADFGSNFQFTSFVGVGYRFNQNILVNARFQHMSNASIADPNPGLNQVMLGLNYQFDTP